MTKIEAQLRALESLGVTKEKYAAMLFPLVESRLSAEILCAWERYVGYSSDESRKKDLDSLMKFLSIEVSSEDRIKLARNSFDSEKSNLKKLGNLSTTATAADLFNSKSEGSSPLKDISIPRLELLACVLGTRLAASVKNDLNLPDVRIYYLTDSMTALAWIQRTRDWGVFVSNRVKEIRNLSDVSSWEHVPSEKEFRDILSWSCSAQQLVYLRWWEGPSWLSESPVQCPRSKTSPR
ncbi:integrase catalytic domain-containing protein [Trichonephila clavipes]|nr:integrase catalytic domain-containing protein [Trichonephila clavipes]